MQRPAKAIQPNNNTPLKSRRFERVAGFFMSLAGKGGSLLGGLR